MGKPRKLTLIGPTRIREAIRRAPSLRQAATELGVDHSALSRWQERQRRQQAAQAPRGAPISTLPEGLGQTPEEWAQHVRETYALLPHHERLLECAVTALTVRNATKDDGVRLRAISTFQSVLKQLDLPNEEDGDALATTHATARPA